jgi:hypothetical protein
MFYIKVIQNDDIDDDDDDIKTGSKAVPVTTPLPTVSIIFTLHGQDNGSLSRTDRTELR